MLAELRASEKGLTENADAAFTGVKPFTALALTL